MDLSLVKSIVESNLTSLHGSIQNLDFDRVEDTTDGYKIDGTFRISFGMQEYTFSMKMDQQGKISLYEKKLKNTDPFGRVSIS